MLRAIFAYDVRQPAYHANVARAQQGMLLLDPSVLQNAW
jgi:hypothetical protein